MPDIEEKIIRSARDSREQLSKESGVSLEALEQHDREILKLAKEITAENKKQLATAEDYNKFLDKHSDNLAKGKVILEKQRAEIAARTVAIKHELQYLDESNEADKARIKYLKEEHEELVAQGVTLSDYIEQTRRLIDNQREYSSELQTQADLVERAFQTQLARTEQVKLLREEEEELQELYNYGNDKTKREQGAKLSANKNRQNFFANIGDMSDSQKITGLFKSLVETNKAENMSLIDAIKTAYNQLDDEENKKLLGETGENMSNMFAKGLGKSGLVEGIKEISKGVKNLSKTLDKYVDQAAQFLTQNKGQLNAALYGYTGAVNAGENFSLEGGDLFQAYSDQARALTGGTLISKQAYLSNIRALAQQGIAGGVQTAALFQTIAEKTVPQFSATSDYVRRLVKLQETNATQRFFGLESILQKSLNAQFGESSYLNALFDSVNSNLMDAMNNLKDSLTENNRYGFLSATQNWLSYLYEQGIDQSTIQRMSTVINALGSGNISGVASDSGMQKLMLLAMDNANLDYASILQEGLNADTVNALFSSMVGYLGDVASNTSSNNVLENAYANLFGLSMTDMYAFAQGIQGPSSYINDATQLNTEVRNRLGLLSQDTYTTTAERVNNFIDNVIYDFGENIANNVGSYLVWKGSNLALDLANVVSGLGAPGKVASIGLQTAGSIGIVGTAGMSLINTVKDVANGIGDAISTGENSIQLLYDTIETGGSASAIKAAESFYNTSKNREKTKEEKENEAALEEEANQQSSEMKVLEELEKTFMKNKAGNYVIAVSLQDMNDEVLKSFASIFANEDSMEGVFKKKNKNKLFDYSEDTTSATDNLNRPTGK